MISYRPVPELVLGRKGFKSAIAAMAMAAVIGTTAFAPQAASAAPSASPVTVTPAATFTAETGTGRQES